MSEYSSLTGSHIRVSFLYQLVIVILLTVRRFLPIPLLRFFSPLFKVVNHFVGFLFLIYRINFQGFCSLFRRCAECTFNIISVRFLCFRCRYFVSLYRVLFETWRSCPWSLISTSKMLFYISYLIPLLLPSFMGPVTMSSVSHNCQTTPKQHTHLVNNVPYPDIVMSLSKLVVSDVLRILENSGNSDQCGVLYFDAVSELRSCFLILLLLLLARRELCAETSWP